MGKKCPPLAHCALWDCPDMEYEDNRFDLGIPCDQALMVGQMGSNEDTTYVNVTLTNNATYRAKGETES